VRVVTTIRASARTSPHCAALQHSALSAAPEQNPYSLHVRAPQQSQSDMQVEAAAELQACEQSQLGPIERAKCGDSEEFFVPMCGARVGFRFELRVLGVLGVGGMTHALPSLMTNVLPALPHAKRSARGVPMNAEPEAAAVWVLEST
jgi:hypothetical protein